MNSIQKPSWVSDQTDKKLNELRQYFLKGLEEHSKGQIAYYDFLLVAKKLNLRFEESSHLMELRKYFFNNKNIVTNRKLSSFLCVQEKTLKQIVPGNYPQKIIIRFNIGNEVIESIKQVTNEDEDFLQVEHPMEETNNNLWKQQQNLPYQDKEQYQEKLAIILSIKVSEMIKKIKVLIEGVSKVYEDQTINTNIFTIFNKVQGNYLQFQVFKKGLVSLIKKLESEMFREKLTMSEDDIKALFIILDTQNNGEIDKESLQQLKNQTLVAKRITKLYEKRVNKKMIKNTMFKLAKNSNSIQIYQVKNASVLEFKSIQEGLLEQKRHHDVKPKSRTPHFGPIKGYNLRSTPLKLGFNREDLPRNNKSALSTYKFDDDPLNKQREKIQKIIRISKEQKKKPGKDTVANKLRKLFIHKVILPREKLLEEEKQKYLQTRSQSSQLIVRLI